MEGAIAINWWAVIVAAVIKFLIGWAWYSPAVFGKPWMELSGVKMEGGSGMAQAIVAQLVGDLIMAYILGRFIIHYGASSLLDGVIIGFMAWIGFVATIMIGSVFYEKKPMQLYYINAGYQLVGIVVMGAILAVWQ